MELKIILVTGNQTYGTYMTNTNATHALLKLMFVCNMHAPVQILAITLVSPQRLTMVKFVTDLTYAVSSGSMVSFRMVWGTFLLIYIMLE
jgi:hypothetical protein